MKTGWLNKQIREAQEEMDSWPQWMRDSACVEGSVEMSEAGLQVVGEIARLESRIADQAKTIDSLKRALAASQDDLETLMKTTRILNRMPKETERRRALTAP